MQEKYERQMKKGVLDMLVLKLLKEEPKYGYQMIQEMKEKSQGVFVPDSVSAGGGRTGKKQVAGK